MARLGPGHVYDLAVVGAGIAGSEAALAAARGGLDVLLVTTSLDTVYMLAHDDYPLQPPPRTLMAQLVGTLAGDGGEMGRWELHRAAKYALEAEARIHLLQSNVTALVVEDGRARGVATWEGVRRDAQAVVLAAGSFLRARLRQGKLEEASGRLGEMAYHELHDDLSSYGFEFVRASLGLSDPREGPPYSVEFDAFSRSELAGDGFSLERLGALLAVGACLQPELSYEEAAAEGLRLGETLASSRPGRRQ